MQATASSEIQSLFNTLNDLELPDYVRKFLERTSHLPIEEKFSGLYEFLVFVLCEPKNANDKELKSIFKLVNTCKWKINQLRNHF